MKITKTDGTIEYWIDMCIYCQMNTVGGHEWNCPLAGNYGIAIKT